MILDIPPHIEKVIVQRAELQGVTVQEVAIKMLEKDIPKERPFNFDLDEMKKAVESGFEPMPKFKSDQEFLDWVNS
ncbi:MAG: hypothetical protein Q4D05_04780 [Acinetobacter sp.]|nr:hypothetical protein [Acinetobacter sp.]